MRKSKQFMAMPVISLEEGQQIGNIKGLIIDPVKKVVSALVIEQKGWFKEQKFIPFNKINSVGNDAITVEQSNTIQKGTVMPDIYKLYKANLEINGTKIVTETGTALGYIDEYYVQLTDGAIAGIEFSGKLINSMLKGKAYLDSSFIRTIGKEVIVVYEEAMDNIIKLEGGIQETVKQIKHSTGSLWDSTLKKTKELSSNISTSLTKPFEKNTNTGKDKLSGNQSGLLQDAKEEPIKEQSQETTSENKK
ncbi:conserved hypothetical protein [Desulfofarcimen acetoxidans DSM 771]|jgi:uncharacterized protein YrrD|uniref:PRC-barrel domain-containing protein n=1 Tax=Desulfofarcimen acetoxidans (strain ATCC 49208 / DSM 771 / KCTC 5769 / VKM B-1644 / 5575) TaxID=485916 RepID=C8W304_DESAS|nr:PRC-barrel domain-containing protein [Desulfofarcimen acetoxidans]ACV61160.1 conserved hypothetical protein [Desulfofarcimen acetoxidans DSM 771]